jgi:predicted GNAT family N-acyltransferase
MKKNSDISFKIISSPEELIAAYNVRFSVFCEEQNVPYHIEADENESKRIHIIGFQDKEPVATGRMYITGVWLKLERIAVRKAWRSHKIGSNLVNFMIKTGNNMGIFKYKLNSQVSNIKFYERLGFKIKGKVFMEAGIEHILMFREDNT